MTARTRKAAAPAPVDRRALLDALLDADPSLVDRFLLAAQSAKPKEPIHTQYDAVRVLLLPHLVGFEQERLVVLALDRRRKLVDIEILSVGSADFTIVCTKTIFRWVLGRSVPVAAILLAHNHPSGDAEPSSQDIDVTTAIARAGRVLGIRLVDHIVVAGVGQWVSLAERGILPVWDSPSDPQVV